MADDLQFPRIIYRGAPDTLGRGPHAHDETGELVGETARCEDAADLAAKQKDGWRLTREIAEPVADAPEPDGKKAKK